MDTKETARAISDIIPGSMEYAATLQTTTPPLPKPDRKWLDKWLRLETAGQATLQAFELHVQRFCAGVFKNPREGRLLLAYGANGNAKTHVFEAIKKWFNTVCRSNYFVERENVIRMPYGQFWSFPKLLRELKDGNWKLIDELESCELLCLDELGGGHDPSTVGVDVLCQILSARERKWTYIATNVAPESWEQSFDKRITSRFFRNSTMIDLCDVPDYPLTKGS